MFDSAIFQTPLSRWLAVAATLLAALIAGRIAGALLRAAARRIDSRLLQAIADQSQAPITTLLMVFAVRASLELLSVPPDAVASIDLGFKFLVILILTWLVIQVYEALHVALFVPYARSPEAGAGLHVFVVLRTVVRVLLWVVGIASGLHTVGLEVGAVLAALGIGGIALALAAQDTVANVFGGFLIMFQRPFKVGERIDVAGIDGWVENLGLRNTAIRNLAGRLVLVPNKKFTDSVVTNVDSQGVYKEEVRLRLDVNTPADRVERALRILHDIVEEDDALDDERYVFVGTLGHGWLEIEFKYAIAKWDPRDPNELPGEYIKITAAKTRVHLEILRRFAAEGIRLAIPTEARVGVEAPARAGLAH